MKGNVLNYFEESQVAFLRVPKFLRKLVTTKGAELYAILRERRRWLVEYKKIPNHQGWFYYPTKELQDDLLPPNSVNYIKELLDQLEIFGLIETKVIKRPTSVKYYKINDERYFDLAQKEANNWVTAKEEEYKKDRAQKDTGEDEYPVLD